MKSYYANILAYRITPNELVLEFGNFFAGQGERANPEFQDFDIRVVMSPNLLAPLIQLLDQAKNAHELQTKSLLTANEQPSEKAS